MQQQLNFARRLQAKLVPLTEMSRTKKRAAAFAFDLICCVFAALLSLSLRLGYWQVFTMPVLILSGLAIASFVPIFLIIGVYTQIMRFNGIGALFQMGRGCLYMMIPMSVIIVFITIDGIPRTMAVLQPLIFLIMIAAGRMAVRALLIDAAGRLKESRKRAMIYGAGGAGRQLAASLEHESEIDLFGFFDDDPQLDRHKLDGKRIEHTDRLERLVEERDLDLIFLALPNISRARRGEIIHRLRKLNVQVQTLPELRAMVDGSVAFSDLRPIRIEDLLGRDQREPDHELLNSNVAGKVVLVSGAGGSIGSELCRQIIRCGPKRLVLFDSSEFALFSIERELAGRIAKHELPIELEPQLGSVSNEAKVERLFAAVQPDTVYHAAAYKHVPLVEANPLSGIDNNVFGTFHMAEAAKRHGTPRFILISTDKAVRPTNVMGATKRICELILQALADGLDGKTVFTMVRFGNVLGSSGSVVPAFERQIREGGPVTLTHPDVTRFFMTVPEAAQLVIQAGAMANGGDVFLLDMGNPVRIYDLAETMIRLAGRSVRDADHPDGDIEIRTIGLRPGEKLYEELLIGSHPQPTAHPRISRSSEEFISESALRDALKQMREFVDRGARSEAIALVSQLVPEYHPADNCEQLPIATTRNMPLSATGQERPSSAMTGMGLHAGGRLLSGANGKGSSFDV